MSKRDDDQQQLEQYGFIIQDSDEELGQSQEDALIEVNDDLKKQLDSLKSGNKSDNASLEENIEEEENPDVDPDEEETEHLEDEAEPETVRPLKTKSSNRISEGARIKNLTKQLKTVQSDAYQLQKNQERERYNANELAKTILLERQEKLDIYEKYIQSEKKNVLGALEKAEDEGDSAVKAQATDLLSQYNAALSDVSRDKRELEKNIASQRASIPQRDTQREEQREFSPPPVIQEWLSSNPWANPKDKNFDRVMWDDADQYSLELEKSYKLDGRAEEVGSPDFLQEISEYINENYRISSSPTNKTNKTVQMKKPETTISPVKRTSPTGQSPQPKSYKDISLSDVERRVAWGLVGNRDAKGNVANNREEAVEQYKREKFLMMKGK